MNATRQDAWTQDEDIILAETVLRYIREGKTQLEAFKEVAKQLSRTSAACGFRWNASIRKQYQDAIDFAKEERKQGGRQKSWNYTETRPMQEDDPINTAILLLEKMRTNFTSESQLSQQEEKEAVNNLKKENEILKEQLKRYEEAWREMGNLWNWVKENKM
ncbi:transcription factor, RsfA family [Virgibacillus subterraneus]|uniref:Transcription factor, RsfA family n=2 Tax=Virgibacillus TaxID=84406 RepID=A0A1H1CGH2_9BACI|nr:MULTISPECIES: RsfA family transcriptional regulator [Virgibacillus]SDQ63253.1 transcription factor, RsfA family [Virgibacillus salinus]SEQ61491.1 transcription factor, RsfA family [Virgibacillus subterraneus]